MKRPPRFITQGQYYIEHRDPQCSVTTILGSCISACIHAPLLPAGGMNHFLIANPRGGTLPAASYGHTAMEVLIDGLIRLGARRSELRAKVFGGSDMMNGLSTVGECNTRFCLDYLANENIPVEQISVGGKLARRIMYWPMTGEVTERLIDMQISEPAAALVPGDGPGLI